MQLVGAAIGFVVGGPAGAQVGFMLGSIAQAAMTPAVQNEGPRLTDLKAAAITYGSTIPYVEGHPRLGGVVVWASDKREIATTTSSGGKGGGGGAESTMFTYEQDVMFMLSENINWVSLRRVWRDGELVWTRADDGEPTSIASEPELWSRITLYDGNAAQLPDPTYEAVVGVGNAPAYRTRCTLFIESLQLGGGAGRLPNLTFEGSA